MTDFSSLVGIPWREGGRDRGGVDCYGLLCVAYREIYGIALPLLEDVAVPCLALDEIGLAPWVERTGTPQAGDAVLYRRGRAFHLAIHAGATRVLNIEQGGQSALWPVSRVHGRRPVFYRLADRP